MTAEGTGFGNRSGRVESFDADTGLGHIVEDSGDRWLFHCTAIADGTRMIAANTSVSFVLGPGGPGRWEAFSVTS